MGKEEGAKIALFCNVEPRAVIEERDKEFSIYEVPVSLVDNKLDELIVEKLNLKARPLDITGWRDMLKRMTMAQGRDTTQGLEIYAMAQQVPPATMKAYWKAMMNEDVSGALKDLKPAFQFVGSSRLWPDTTTWVTVAKQLGYDDAGAVTARRIGNCGALIMKEQPDSLAAVIDEFSARAIAGRK